MGKYTQLSADIIQNVGGKENVKKVIHCVTRLRFYLKDESKANDEILKNMDGVVTVVKAMGQYMVVIGEHVADVYDEVCLQLGIQAQGSGERKADTSKEKKSLLDRGLGVVMSGMISILNLMCACGMVKGLTVVAVMLGLPETSGVHALLNAAGDCLFYSLPLVLGFNIAKKYEIDPFFGLLLGAALTYPSIQGVDLDFFGYTVNATYTSSFLPVLFGLLFAIPLYKWLDRHIHKLLKGFLTPLITLLFAFPLTFLLIGPFAHMVGNGINFVINFLFELSPILGGVVLGGLWQILVMFGVHGVLVAFAFYDLLAGNPSTMIGITCVVCFAVCGTLLGTILKTKSEQIKSAGSSALVSAFLGVTEPAMYGIIISKKQLLAATCIGGSAGGLAVGLFGLKAYTYAGIGIIGMLGFLNPEGANFPGVVLVVVIPFLVSFLVTMLIYKEESTQTAKTEKQNASDAGRNTITIKMPADGKIKPMSEAQDEVFASETLGKGCVVQSDDGKVYAPVNGTITTLFPTKHAIGITSSDGVEVLIHIGINTVALEGKYFEEKVKQGDHVATGQLLMCFDKEVIEKEGYSTEIPLVITNTADYLDVVELEHKHYKHGEEILKIFS